MPRLDFDVSSVEPAVNTYELLPRGRYLAMIINSDIRDTKAGDGTYVEWTFEVMEGPHKGRRLWERMNFRNKNQTTEQIAKRNLAALSIACGFPDHVGETEGLHNIPIFIEVIREMPKDGSAERNQIRGYSAGGAQGANVTPMAKAPSADERRAPVWKSRV